VQDEFVALRFWRFSIADRLEVWNPGSLPGTLELDDLRHDHASVPNNPLIAEPLYLARYITGRGTHYVLAGKRDINGTNGTSGRSPSKGAKAL